MERVLRVGMIGCGDIAAQRAKQLAACPLTRIVHTMDLNGQLAADLAAPSAARVSTDMAAVLADPDVDAVVLSTPHHLHCAQTLAAAEAGKHVLVEKPIATTLADADRMIGACERAGVTLAVCYDWRHRPVVREARRLVAAGAVGRVVACHMAAAMDKPAHYWTSGWSRRAQTDWRTRVATAGGGVLLTNASHNIDAMFYVTGLVAERVTALVANRATPSVEVEDFASVLIAYRGGAAGTVLAASAWPGGGEQADRIVGDAGQIVYAGRQLRLFVREAFEGLEPGRWHEFEPKLPAEQLLVHAWADAVLAGREPPIGGRSARAALEVVRAAYRSGGDPIDLPLADDAEMKFVLR